MKQDWEAGVAEAYEAATADKMRPPPARRGQRPLKFPRWWEHPHEFDPTAHAPRGEEELLHEGPDAAEGNGDDDNGEDNDDDNDDDTNDNDDNDDDDDDDDTPLALLMGAHIAAGAESITQTLMQPNGQRRHKTSVLLDLVGKGTKLSADRCVRVQQGREEASPAPFNAAMDDWNMGIGSDIAIHFEEGNNIFVGRVVQMRKRYTNGRYVKYKRSVILHEDREKLGDLFVSCMFYTRVRSALSNTERVFKLKDNNTTAMNYKEYHVTTVVCPLNLTYHVATESYLLDATGDDIINTQLGGNTTWAIH